MGRWFLVIGVALVAVLIQAAVVSPGRANNRRRDPTRGPDARVLPRASRSVGLPHRGRLRRGVKAVENAHLRYVTEYEQHNNFYGTWELVQLVERAAYRVSRRVPGAKLSIGELSSTAGGDIPGHSSHENGRDVDLSFYMLDARGRPFEPFGFARFDAHGRGRGPNEGLRFDDARNWELVAKLVADGDARVQYIFVAAHIKRRLIREGRRRRAPARVLDRAAQVMVQPGGNHPHDNHFHLRIYCAPNDRPACKDQGPIYPWYPGPR